MEHKWMAFGGVAVALVLLEALRVDAARRRHRRAKQKANPPQRSPVEQEAYRDGVNDAMHAVYDEAKRNA